MKSPEVMQLEQATKLLQEIRQTETDFLKNMTDTAEMLRAYEQGAVLPATLKRLLTALTNLEQTGQSFFPLIENAEILFTEQKLSEEQLTQRQEKLNTVFSAHLSFISNAAIEYSACMEELQQNTKMNTFFLIWLTNHKITHQPSALFIMPVQRIPRYKMLIEEIIKNGNKTALLLTPSLEKAKEAADQFNTKQRIMNVENALQTLSNNKKGIKKGLITLARVSIQPAEIAALTTVHNELRYAELNNYLKLINKELITKTGCFLDAKTLTELTELIPVESYRDTNTLNAMRTNYQLILKKARDLAEVMQPASNSADIRSLILYTQQINAIKKEMARANTTFSSREAQATANNKEKYIAYLNAFQERINIELNFIKKRMNQLYIKAKNNQYETLKERVKGIVTLLQSINSESVDALTTQVSELDKILVSPDLMQKDSEKLKQEDNALGLEESTISEYADYRRKQIESIKDIIRKAFPNYIFPMYEEKAQAEARRTQINQSTEGKTLLEETSPANGLTILADIAVKTCAIVKELDQWLENKGNDNPAFETFAKHLTADEQKEFLDWIYNVMPPLPGISRPTNMEDFISYCKTARGNRQLKENVAILQQKNQLTEREAKTEDELRALQKSKSFVRLLSESSIQYLHSGCTKATGKGGGYRDQICIDATEKFCAQAKPMLNPSEKALYDCNEIISALSTLESFHQNALSAQEEGAVDLNLTLQFESANRLMPLFQEMLAKHSQDTALKSVITHFYEMVETIPAVSRAGAASVYTILEQNIAYLKDLQALNPQLRASLEKSIQDTIATYEGCITQYKLLSISHATESAKKEQLLHINKKLSETPFIFGLNWVQDNELIQSKLPCMREIDLPYSLVEIEHEAEPFAGFSRKAKEETEVGKQEKSAHTDVYTCNTTGKKYFIKKSKEYQADDIAERLTSSILQLAIDQHAVPYITVPTKKDPTIIYLASEMVSGFQTLKTKIKHALTEPLTGKPLRGADLVSSENKTIAYNALSPVQRKGVAKILAGCLWVNNKDCQIANILIDEQNNAKVFDFGWALANICKPENVHVKLFEPTAPMNLDWVGMHPPFHPTNNPNFVPTNHFNDYPNIVRSQDFVDALEEILPILTNIQTITGIGAAIDRIMHEYSNIGEHKALSLFAHHIGLLPNGKEFSEEMTTENIKQQIKMTLTASLKRRASSMAVLKCMLQMDLALKEVHVDPHKIASIMQELQDVLYSNFDINRTPINQMLPPPYDAKIFNTVRGILSTVKPQDRSPTIDEMETYCTFMLNVLNGDLETKDWQAQQLRHRRSSISFRPGCLAEAAVTIHTGKDVKLRRLTADATVQIILEQRKISDAVKTKEHSEEGVVQTVLREPLPSLEETKRRVAEIKKARLEAACIRAEMASTKAMGFAETAARFAESTRRNANLILPVGQKLPPPPPKS